MDIFQGPTVIMKAGHEIRLEPGFHAHAGSDFHAFIDYVACTSIQRLGTHNESNNNSNIETFSKNRKSEYFLSPNPSTGIFSLQLNENAGEVFIYNPLGQVVYEMDNIKWPMANGNTSAINPQPLTIDISSRPAGIYFIKVISEGNIYTEKVVLQ